MHLKILEKRKNSTTSVKMKKTRNKLNLMASAIATRIRDHNWAQQQSTQTKSKNLSSSAIKGLIRLERLKTRVKNKVKSRQKCISIQSSEDTSPQSTLLDRNIVEFTELLKLQAQGICIIRLITLKRLQQQIPEHKHQQKQHHFASTSSTQEFNESLPLQQYHLWQRWWRRRNHLESNDRILPNNQRQQQINYCKISITNSFKQQQQCKHSLTHYPAIGNQKPAILVKWQMLKWHNFLCRWHWQLYVLPLRRSRQNFAYNSENHTLRLVNARNYKSGHSKSSLYPLKATLENPHTSPTNLTTTAVVETVSVEQIEFKSRSRKEFQTHLFKTQPEKSKYHNIKNGTLQDKEGGHQVLSPLSSSSSPSSLSSPATTAVLLLSLAYYCCSALWQRLRHSLPSLSSLPRTFILLMLLSSLWHGIECFHGTVKLSTNTVKTKYGLVRGIVVRSSPLVEAYLGVPYASPPVGSLRFMPPITPSTWKNVRNADRFSAVCPQTVPIPPNGPEALLEVPRARLAQLRRLLPLLSNQSEDCLYLNIYVPYENRRRRRFTVNSSEMDDSQKLATILFIHGESYEWNSGNPYDGSELAAHGNVVVVTINFRLGIFGFLKTGGKESAQGNFGLMDLVAGLHWLKENLPAFGGDPQSITLLGHGTGAALANILVVSPVASDLVQRSVLVSGSALSSWAIQKNPLFVKRRVAEQTGCHGDMLYDDLAPCLRTKSVAQLLSVKIDYPRFLVGFAPFVDGTVISPSTDSIDKLTLPLGSAIVSTSGIEYANFPKRNLIFCLTSVESHLDLNAQDLEFGFNETRRDRILRTFVRNNFHYHLNEIFAVLKNEYTDWEKAIRSPLSSRDATLAFLSDGHTASSLIKLGYMHNLRGGKSYFLHFKHRTVEEEYPQRTGSVRGEDIPFWLGLPISPLFPHNYTTQEKQISHLMLRYLANFARTGNPNQSSLNAPLPTVPSAWIALAIPSIPPVDFENHQKIKRSSTQKTTSNINNIMNKIQNITSLNIIIKSSVTGDTVAAAAKEALNLAVLYNQRRTKRTYYQRHSRSNNNDSQDEEISSDTRYPILTNANGNDYERSKAEIQSHYRGHKLSMWLNLIPQLHRHTNINDLSMRHHQFQDDINNMNLYEGIVRPQLQVKPADDDDDTLLISTTKSTLSPKTIKEVNNTQKTLTGSTGGVEYYSQKKCGIDGALFVAEMTTQLPNDNRSSVVETKEKDLATASTGLIGNLEVLRRLSSKQFQSYTTALIATVAVGCFLLVLNILIFAGIYHQREKRARDAKTKEELQDKDTSKNSSMLKLNTIGSESSSFNGSAAGLSGKTSIVFGEYSCYDEKSLQNKDEKLMIELPPPQIVGAGASSWGACSTSTLDLLKTKHYTSIDTVNGGGFNLTNVGSMSSGLQNDQNLFGINSGMEMVTYKTLPPMGGLLLDNAATSTSAALKSKHASLHVDSTGQINQYEFASVQSSDQMSFRDIEDAVKASTSVTDVTQDDDIPEPPPPPKSFQNSTGSTASSIAGGILRQAGTASSNVSAGGNKKHVESELYNSDGEFLDRKNEPQGSDDKSAIIESSDDEIFDEENIDRSSDSDCEKIPNERMRRCVRFPSSTEDEGGSNVPNHETESGLDETIWTRIAEGGVAGRLPVHNAFKDAHGPTARDFTEIL
uniref:Carboxylesterase type B domain-containing protein n=1 Tax=Glossina morsitans morsitans TaxID=37546 RepID=A0A1B0GDA2_GLOMM